MNSVSSTHAQLHYQLPSLHYLSKSSKEGLSRAHGSRIVSDKLNGRGFQIDDSPKSGTMYNSSKKPVNVGGMTDKSNNRNSSGFQQHQASNNSYLNFASGQGLGTSGLMVGSSQTALHQQAQTQALAHQQQQQRQRLLQMTNNNGLEEVHQMASNIQETLMIKKRLDQIQSMESLQQLQQKQQDVNKLRAELASQVTTGGIGLRNSASILSSGTKHVPSSSNSSVVPTKQREDEMTKPDLSTLAETAVAVATAATANAVRRNSGMLGIGGVMKPNISDSAGNNRIAALLGRRNSSTGSKESSQSLPSITSSLNSAVTDILRRDLSATREKLHLENSYKRSLDEMTKSVSTSAPSSSSWLWKSAGLGSTTTMEQLRAQHEQLQRRNSLPARSSSLTSEFAPLRSMKRQRILDQKASAIERLEIHEAMKQMRQLDASMNLRQPSSNSLLAEMASKLASQERRSSIASSIASVGTSATAPNLTTTSALSSPVNRRSLTMLESNLEERSRVLDKLSKLGGGFPMPKSSFATEGVNTASGGITNNAPAEITPEAGKDIVDIIGRRSISLKNQLNAKQSRLGGFPMPPLYWQNGENQVSNSSIEGRGQFDGSGSSMNEPDSRISNAVSSHIRNNLNCGGTKASRPPALESYKRVWREIRVVAGDDPVVDERLRREVFARKLQRGQIFVGKTGNTAMGNMNNRYVNTYAQQLQLSDLSRGSGNASGRTKGGETADESIVI